MFTKKTRNTEHSADKKIKYLFGEEEASDIEKRFFGFCPHNDLVKAKAFTLAEVLITLGTIGIVAAMTIPSLITKYNKQQTAIRLKKNYAIIENAFALANAEESYSSWTWCSSGIQQSLQGCPFKDKIAPKLKIIKSYGAYDSSGMGPMLVSSGYPSFDFLHFSGSAAVVVLQDGSLVFFATPNPLFWQASVGLDVNGLKGPNKPGIDVFSIKLICNQNMTCKFNTYYDETNCRKGLDPHRVTLGCMRKIQKDGWKIADDYPWQDLLN